MNSRSIILFAALSAFSAVCQAEHANVAALSDSDYQSSIEDGKVYFVKFFAPWCGHCKRLAPTWEQLGSALSGNADIVVAKVDCTVSKDICSKAGVRGYPTLKLFHKGAEQQAYKGARDLAALKKFAEDSASSLIETTS
ncbi:hypothetical protein CYMTET_10510 [Cymbomonas tetramitiformis]|uniref:Thioredoxin domain-containing protein n=1 Tax=Cymbomonas tetramitiformis TaxID=36881 RepID=A0AAE0LEE9_9CHLO|nr:hypothetical protein CYMTET_10510 [Cymbomonas tetramitiformis]